MITAETETFKCFIHVKSQFVTKGSFTSQSEISVSCTTQKYKKVTLNTLLSNYFMFYYILSGCLWEIINKRKFEVLHSKSVPTHLMIGGRL